MRYSRLGNTGVQVSRLALGTATFGVAPLKDEAERLVRRAFDLGINLFDTANSYGNQSRFDRPGSPSAESRESAEQILGRALKGKRLRVLVTSKVMEPVGNDVNDRGLSRLHIMNQVEKSLVRLGTDYLDVYYAHHPDPATPIDQSLRAFEDLVRQGKIRYYALSTFRAWQMVEAAWAGERLGFEGPVCNQIPYSVVSREAEKDVLPACDRLGLTVTVFSPLAGGLLSGEDVFERAYVGHARWGGPRFSEAERKIAQQFYAIAKAGGYTPSVAALAWLASKPLVTSAIIGPESIEELEANIGGGNVDLPAEVLTKLDALVNVEHSWAGV